MLGFGFFFLLDATEEEGTMNQLHFQKEKKGVYITRDFNFEHQTSKRSLPSHRCPALKVQHVSK